jgi:hypothetical protein
VTTIAAVTLLPLALAWLGIAAWIAFDDHRWGRHVDQALDIANHTPDTELADLLDDRIPPNPLQPGREQL